jgi:hypothetical protein
MREKRANGFDQFARMQKVHVNRLGGQLKRKMRGSKFLNNFVEVDRSGPGFAELRKSKRIAKNAIALGNGIAQPFELRLYPGLGMRQGKLQVESDGLDGAEGLAQFMSQSRKDLVWFRKHDDQGIKRAGEQPQYTLLVRGGKRKKERNRRDARSTRKTALFLSFFTNSTQRNDRNSHDSCSLT